MATTTTPPDAPPTPQNPVPAVGRPHTGYSRYRAMGMLSCSYTDTTWRNAARLTLEEYGASCFWKAILEVLSLAGNEPFAGFDQTMHEARTGGPPGFLMQGISLTDAFEWVNGTYPIFPENTPLGIMIGTVSVVVIGGEPFLEAAITHNAAIGQPSGRGVVLVFLDDNGRRKPHWLPVSQFTPNRRVKITNREAIEFGIAPDALNAEPIEVPFGPAPRPDPVPPPPLDFRGVFPSPNFPTGYNISGCVGLECLPVPGSRKGCGFTSFTFFYQGTRLLDSGDVHILRRLPHAGDRAWHQRDYFNFVPRSDSDRLNGLAWQLHPKIVNEMHIDSKSYVYVRIGEWDDATQTLRIVTSAGENFLSSGDYNPKFMKRLYTENGCFVLDEFFDVIENSPAVYRVFKLKRAVHSVFGFLKSHIPFTLDKVIDPATLRFIPQNIPKFDPARFPNKKAWLACVFTTLLDQAPSSPALRSALTYCRSEALGALADGDLPDQYDPVENLLALVRMQEAVSGLLQTEGLAKIK